MAQGQKNENAGRKMFLHPATTLAPSNFATSILVVEKRRASLIYFARLWIEERAGECDFEGQGPRVVEIVYMI